MRLLLDENMSDRRLAARLRAQGHDPVLATDVGLLSATDARVFIGAITQALPVLTRDSEDFTDLHDLIMAAGGHQSGVLVVPLTSRRRKHIENAPEAGRQPIGGLEGSRMQGPEVLHGRGALPDRPQGRTHAIAS
jgi:predicted nuclease of predicted toxin-antitoxin system